MRLPGICYAFAEGDTDAHSTGCEQPRDRRPGPRPAEKAASVVYARHADLGATSTGRDRDASIVRSMRRGRDRGCRSGLHTSQPAEGRESGADLPGRCSKWPAVGCSGGWSGIPRRCRRSQAATANPRRRRSFTIRDNSSPRGAVGVDRSGLLLWPLVAGIGADCWRPGGDRSARTAVADVAMGRSRCRPTRGVDDRLLRVFRGANDG